MEAVRDHGTTRCAVLSQDGAVALKRNLRPRYGRSFFGGPPSRTGLVGSPVRQATGRGSRAVEYLREHADQPLSALGLIGQGNRIFALMGSSSRMIEATADGQVVIAIDVEPIEKDLRTDVTELSTPREIDVRVRGSTYRAVLKPDLEAGGYTVEVPELPGCISEGDTLTEARRMARDAIQAWLDASAANSAQKRAHSR